MAQPVFPDQHTAASYNAFPHPQFITRTRREFDTNKQAPFYDMMPDDSRMSSKSHRSQPRFDTSGGRGGENPYFDKYDTTSDARNMTRELKASVYEDKNTGYTKESNMLLQRQFDNRWLDPTVAKQQAAAAEELRPKMDDIRMFYQNKPVDN